VEAEQIFSADHVLSHTDQVIAISDRIVLDRCQRCVNLRRLLIAERILQARWLDFSGAWQHAESREHCSRVTPNR